MIEVLAPRDREEELDRTLEELGDDVAIEAWRDRLAPSEADRAQARILVADDRTQEVMDALQSRFASVEGFRVVVSEVEATIPRPEPEADEDGVEEPESGSGPELPSIQISREELYEDVQQMSQLTTNFLLFMAVATVVAVIGLLLDNVAIVIGSMVIAPLIGPSVGMALSTTLADRALGRKAATTKLAGLAVGALVSVVAGMVLAVDPQAAQLALRSRVTLWDVGLGLAVGAAGALSVTTGLSAALVGVMVAVALLPPLAAFGLFLGSGQLGAATGALLLLLTYIISINLAGVVTFAGQGISPRTWWEAEKARRASRTGVVIWAILLSALVVIIFYTRGEIPFSG